MTSNMFVRGRLAQIVDVDELKALNADFNLPGKGDGSIETLDSSGDGPRSVHGRAISSVGLEGGAD